jgi:hypothetical protein
MTRDLPWAGGLTVAGLAVACRGSLSRKKNGKEYFAFEEIVSIIAYADARKLTACPFHGCR